MPPSRPPLCCGAPSLPSRRRGAVWLWHFTLAQQSRPVTVPRLYNQLLPRPLAPCCWANYEYSVSMKVILSDMQLSSRIVSAVLFVVSEGSIFQGRDRSDPADFRYVWWQNWVEDDLNTMFWIFLSLFLSFFCWSYTGTLGDKYNNLDYLSGTSLKTTDFFFSKMQLCVFVTSFYITKTDSKQFTKHYISFIFLCLAKCFKVFCETFFYVLCYVFVCLFFMFLSLLWNEFFCLHFSKMQLLFYIFVTSFYIIF